MAAGAAVKAYELSKGQRVAVTFKGGQRLVGEFVAHTDGRGATSYMSFRPLVGNRTIRKVESWTIASIQSL
jgi:hypothetical protein